MPRGGARVGSGRKGKGAAILSLHGGRDRKAGPVGANEPLPEVKRPEGLSEAAQAVWDRLSPHALAGRTLTDGTAEAFAELCTAIVLRAQYEATIARDGLTYLKVTIDGSGQEHQELKKHPLLPELRQLNRDISTRRKEFRIAPIGKEIVVPVKDVDPFEQFDQAAG